MAGWRVLPVLLRGLCLLCEWMLMNLHDIPRRRVASTPFADVVREMWARPLRHDLAGTANYRMALVSDESRLTQESLQTARDLMARGVPPNDDGRYWAITHPDVFNEDWAMRPDPPRNRLSPNTDGLLREIHTFRLRMDEANVRITERTAFVVSREEYRALQNYGHWNPDRSTRDMAWGPLVGGRDGRMHVAGIEILAR